MHLAKRICAVMTDIIQLLPDNIANQIAAGEVIQRPASAVKELLENAVDAGATEIQLFIQDAGKSLIQVIDNGKGMSETDARMCFERHATSKIKKIDDLFSIKTMGFRGEALASIAAVAQVILKTKRATDELGTYIEIENSVVQKQEPCSMKDGTSISMKNLFFSVPARRNFLKSNPSELRHIVDEFIRVAMAYANIQFTLSSNSTQVFYLEAGSLKQRVTQILGTSYASKLVAVNEQNDYFNIYGFVGKPEAAKKTRGDQYFFVNNRFIKSAYLNHAVTTAFHQLLPKDSFPMYTIFIEVDPTQIDINVHPTKQEIKFDDEKVIYAFVLAAIRHALAQFSIAPSLDFTLDTNITQLDAVSKPITEKAMQQRDSGNLYQTFTQKHQAHNIDRTDKSNLTNWQDFLTPATEKLVPTQEPLLPANNQQEHKFPPVKEQQYYPCLQVANTYIVTSMQYDVVIIHQQLAHERILFEKFQALAAQPQVAFQQILFPATIDLSSGDAVLLQSLLPDLQKIGFMIEAFGNNTFIVQGVPASITISNEKHTIELLLEQMKHGNTEMKISATEKIHRSLARQQAVKAGTSLQHKEMQQIITDLFSCNMPNISPTGSPTYTTFSENKLSELFSR